MRILVVLLLVATATAQTGQTTRQLWTADRDAAKNGYVKNDSIAYRNALVKLHDDFPGNSRVLRDLARVEAVLGNQSESVKWLQAYLDRGLTLSFDSPPFAGLRSEWKLQPFVDRADSAKKPVSGASRAFRLNSSDLVAEDIAYDATARRFLISSVRQRKLISCSADGRCEDYVTNSDAPLWGVFALRVDAARNTLWATTASMDPELNHDKATEGKSALLKFDLKSHKLLKQYDAPAGEPHAMGDMVLSSRGDIYVADGLSGDVFVVRVGSDRLDRAVPSGTFISPQTPALSKDDKILYVPDYLLGIAKVSLPGAEVQWLGTEVPAALDGIDGLYVRGDSLVAVQNGTEPERITRFHLSNSGKVDRWRVLEANSPGLGDPTHGVFVGEDFYFIANSGWDRVQDNGDFKQGDTPEVRKIRLQ